MERHESPLAKALQKIITVPCPKQLVLVRKHSAVGLHKQELFPQTTDVQYRQICQPGFDNWCQLEESFFSKGSSRPNIKFVNSLTPISLRDRSQRNHSSPENAFSQKRPSTLNANSLEYPASLECIMVTGHISTCVVFCMSKNQKPKLF